LDVNNVFLHGDLEETVYMQQPLGFIDSLQPNHVCHLRKDLYKLKQTPRAWFHKFKTFLLSHQFNFSTADNSLFIFSSDKLIIYLLVYIDDIIITDNDSEAISSLINTLNLTFSIKDLDTLYYFLGIEIVSSGTNLILTQTRYLTSMLTRANMIGAKSCTTPMQSRLKLSKTYDISLSDPHLYRTIVGALQYATITQPDLTFAVNKLPSLWLIPLIFIGKLLNESCITLMARFNMVFNYNAVINSLLTHIVMLTGLVIRTIVGQQLGMLSIWVITLFLGLQRNKLRFLVLQPKKNVKVWR
jgi:Reverse transcriptase (RNA-dependent DNA polymerase)